MSGDWFDSRVRPLIGGDPADRGLGTWQTVGDLVADETLADVERRLHERDGATPRAALTLYAGWSAGYLAWAIALGVLRDGILVLASRPGAVELLRHPEGYYHDARLVDTEVRTQATEAEAVAEIARACEPLVEALARRSGRGRDGLWAQVADEVADAAFSLQEERGADAARGAVERLLDAPGAPWKHTPALWLADGLLLKHRGSCCLYYRRDAAGEPDYCTTCVFRSRADVEALMLTHHQEPT